MIPKLSKSKENQNLIKIKSYTNSLIEQIENKTEFVNEQKENIKILNNNVIDYEIFLNRLSLWFYQKKLQKKIFYGFKNYKVYKKRKNYRNNIVNYMEKKRKLKLIFTKWKNISFQEMKTKLGKKMILSFKVIYLF